MKKVKILWAIALGLSYVVFVSFISALVVDTNSEWYIALNKPTYMPPKIVFSIVWGLVYVIFCVTFAEMWAKKPRVNIVVGYILLGLVNIFYLAIFFRCHSTLGGLMLCILGSMIAFYITFELIRHNFITSYLFILAILWYIFASVLSYSIVILN